MIRTVGEFAQYPQVNSDKKWISDRYNKENSIFDSPEFVSKEKVNFGDLLNDSISKVNALQVEANSAMEELATGKSQNLHETMLIVERADIAFKTMNQIRSKVIDIYREIMKMQL